MRRAMTSFVALLVSLLLLSHHGLPHRSGVALRAAVASSAEADLPADSLISLSDVKSVTLPDGHGHHTARTGAPTAVGLPCATAFRPLSPSAREYLVPRPDAALAQAVLQVYRC